MREKRRVLQRRQAAARSNIPDFCTVHSILKCDMGRIVKHFIGCSVFEAFAWPVVY
jgi:hypothetical protein